ncbi:MAG: hypothetical protein J5I93_14895 [Pirellulaceae bacterium]|nr:hypothetical protein [Pirellulaceae bacterium]
MRSLLLVGALGLALSGWTVGEAGADEAPLRAGAAIVDVTPPRLPVLVNGGMLSRSADMVKTRVNARAIVLDDGRERLAIVVVDSCMMPRPLLDEAKQLASQRTAIRPDRMLISATHTHSAPASMGCLGTDADPAYVPYLREKLAEAIAAAEANLRPARVGWAVGNAAEYTALRRWIRRPDRVVEDPFGNLTVRANMHAGRVWDDVTGESGPEDPDLAMLAIQTADGQPLAVLANFSMHYFGDGALSADYFGLFCDRFQARVAPDARLGQAPFVAILSHGCSGDIWRRDYTRPVPPPDQDHTIDSYTDGLLGIALGLYEQVKYETDADLAMAEQRMELRYRVPDKQRLEWAQRIVAAMGDRLPKDTTEVYAREQLILHERQSTEVVVQALRIGSMAIATTPNETYALTGLKIKLQSPLPRTMVIELANGGDGYIPPPEQHVLGGYNTWAARSAGLETQAEPRIAEAAVRLLEHVSGQPRRVVRSSLGPVAEAVRAARPVAWWRLDEMAGPRAVDASGNQRDGIYESGVVYFLEGPRSGDFCRDGETNRAAHFAGGRLQTRVADLGDAYSVSLWFWNGMPQEARPISGWMFSRDRDHGLGPWGDHLGLGGGQEHAGKLVLLHGADEENLSVGRTAVERWTWNHLVLVRADGRARVYLNGATQPELDVAAETSFPPGFEQLFFGGRSDNQSNWEGRLDEIAVFGRALTADEIRALAAERTGGSPGR